MYDHWSADLASTADYYPGGMMMPGRNTEYSWSRMGYNGQQKTDEVYGKGNLNTALFWEMDTRILRRWNVDPVDQVSISNYAVFANSPIYLSDVLGNTVKTNEEGAKITEDAMKGTLGSNPNPIGYNKEKGELTFNKDADLSKLNTTQLEVVNKFKDLIESETTTVNLSIVNRTDDIPSLNSTLVKEDANGITNASNISYNVLQRQEPAIGLITKKLIEVYVARDPQFNDNKTPQPNGYSGFTLIHEFGHAHENHKRTILYQPGSIMSKAGSDIRDMNTESFDQSVRNIYKLKNGNILGGSPSGHPRLMPEWFKNKK